MKFTTVVVVLALAGTACGVAAPARQLAIAPDKPFHLSPGDSGRWEGEPVGGTLQVGLDGVTADSRCPKGTQCVWAGSATVRVWLQRGDGAREMRELHTPDGVARIGDMALKLVDLTPYPVSGHAIQPSDYVASFTLSRNAAIDADR